MTRVRGIVVFLALLFATAPGPVTVPAVRADTVFEQENLERILRQLYRDEATMAAIVAQMPIPERLTGVMLEHVRLLFSNDLVISMMAREMSYLSNTITGMSEEEAHAFGKNFGMELITEKALKGVKRLDVESQRLYIVNMMKLVSTYDTPTCAAIIRGEASSREMQDADFAAISEMETVEVRIYLQLVRQAIQAELSGRNHAPVLTDGQAEVASEVVGSNLAVLLADTPDAEALFDALIEPMRSPDREVCEAFILFLYASAVTEGAPGDWAIQTLTAEF